MSTEKEFLAKQEELAKKQNTLVPGSHISLTPQQNGNYLIDTLGVANYRELTKAQYEALTDAEKLNGTLYCLTDVDMGEGGGVVTEYLVDVRVNNQTVVTGSVANIDLTSYATLAQLAAKQDPIIPGDNIQINNNIISATDTTYDDFVGATEFEDGFNGLVPKPFLGSADRFLCADGSWKIPAPIDQDTDPINYSYDEQSTNIRWVDGSLIYQKTFDLTQTTYSYSGNTKTYNINVHDLNIRYLIDTQLVGIKKVYSENMTYDIVANSNHYNDTKCFVGLTQDNNNILIRLDRDNAGIDYEDYSYLTIKYVKPDIVTYYWLFDSTDRNVFYDRNEANLAKYKYGILFSVNNPTYQRVERRTYVDWDSTGVSILQPYGYLDLSRNAYTYTRSGYTDWVYNSSEEEKEFKNFTIEIDIDNITGRYRTWAFTILPLVHFNYSNSAYFGLNQDDDWVFNPDCYNYEDEELGINGADYFDGSTLKIIGNNGQTSFYKNDTLIYTSENNAKNFYGIGARGSFGVVFDDLDISLLSPLCKITRIYYSRLSE